jgi:hypothetical protein
MSFDTKQNRLARLRRLRKMKAPQWIVKMEQIALVLNSEGLKFHIPGKPMSKRQGDLQLKHVCPLLESAEMPS